MRPVVLGALQARLALMALLALLALLAMTACAGEISVEATGTGGDDGPGVPGGDPREPADPPEPSTVRFNAPLAGAMVTRDAGANARGELVAAVAVEIVASADAATVQVYLDGDQDRDGGAPAVEADGFELDATLDLVVDGTRHLTAIALDSSGDELARATLEIEVVAPEAESCLDWLDLYRLDYERGPERPGIDEPVTVTPPINGIDYRYVTADDPRRSMLMDCSLALALLRTAPSLHARDIVEVADIGIYNYRCIGNEGTPPECPRGVSQHAYANAIDIAGYTDAAGLFYSVNDDWVIDPDDEPTCDAPTEPGADALLHEVICEQKLDGIWNIVLTPNYNAAHRNHFHVDLKDGSDFIELWGGPVAMDEGGPAH